MPANAIDRLFYFSNDLRRQVDERDGRRCIVNQSDLTQKRIRYHKISIPGPMTVDNCATICYRHRGEKVLKILENKPETFRGMNYKQFKE